MDEVASAMEGSTRGTGSVLPSRPQGILADPVVRAMVYAAVGLVLLIAGSLIGVLTTGIASPTGPRSVAERELLLAAARTRGAKGAATTPYVDALIAAGDLSAARIAIGQARASLGATESAAGLDLAESRLLAQQGGFEGAAALADKAMKSYEATYRAGVAKGGKTADAARQRGYGEGYYNAALVKANALVELGRFEDAIAAYDIYIVENPTAADILVDRGNAKAELKDKPGAEKDFRTALRFVPYDDEAKTGLKKIGVAQ